MGENRGMRRRRRLGDMRHEGETGKRRYAEENLWVDGRGRIVTWRRRAGCGEGSELRGCGNGAGAEGKARRGIRGRRCGSGGVGGPCGADEIASEAGRRAGGPARLLCAKEGKRGRECGLARGEGRGERGTNLYPAMPFTAHVPPPAHTHTHTNTHTHTHKHTHTHTHTQTHTHTHTCSAPASCATNSAASSVISDCLSPRRAGGLPKRRGAGEAHASSMPAAPLAC